MVANYPPDVGFAWWLMERFWAAIARHVDSQDRKCYLAFPAAGVLPENLEKSPVEPLWLDYSDRTRAGTGRLLNWVQEHGISSIYLTDRPYADRRYLQLRRRGVSRIVLHDHTPGERPPSRGPKGAAKALVDRLGLFSADRYIATTDFIRDRLVDHVRVDPRKCHVVPNGIDVSPAFPDVESRSVARADVREELHLSEGDVVVALVARAHPVKNIDFAVRVAQRLAQVDRCGHVRFVFCGDGPQQQELKTLVADLGLERRFLFAGRRADVPRILGACDIGLHPSRFEVGYCLAILEMMAAALPVVVPNYSSVCGATDHGVTGMHYEGGDEAAAALVLEDLAIDEAKRVRLGSTARSSVVERFSLQKTDAALEKWVCRFL